MYPASMEIIELKILVLPIFLQNLVGSFIQLLFLMIKYITCFFQGYDQQWRWDYNFLMFTEIQISISQREDYLGGLLRETLSM